MDTAFIRNFCCQCIDHDRLLDVTGAQSQREMIERVLDNPGLEGD
jgi:hypothetical protein